MLGGAKGAELTNGHPTTAVSRHVRGSEALHGQRGLPRRVFEHSCKPGVGGVLNSRALTQRQLFREDHTPFAVPFPLAT